MIDVYLSDGHRPAGHLGVEQLSAYLDGESATPRVDRRHLEGCAACRGRLVALELVRDRVRAVVTPVAPHVRTASIAAIVDAAGIDSPRDDAAGTDRDQIRHRKAPERAPARIRPYRRPPVVIGAAAAVVALAVAIGAPLARSSSGPSGHSTASSAHSSPNSAATPATAPRSSPRSQSSTGATEPLSSAKNQPSAAGGGAFASDGAEPDAANAGVVLGTIDTRGALRSRIMASLSDQADAARPGTSPPPAHSGGAAESDGYRAATTSAPFERCLSAAVGAAGSDRTLQLLASVLYRGNPGLVYVFNPATGGHGSAVASHRLAVVTASSGCRVLTTTSL